MNDTISRAENLARLEMLMPTGEKIREDKYKYGISVGLTMAKVAIKDSQPVQRWIPCSKKLPDEKGEYWVTDSKGDVVRFIYTGTKSSRGYWLRCVKAWMPMLKPWEGEKE